MCDPGLMNFPLWTYIHHLKIRVHCMCATELQELNNIWNICSYIIHIQILVSCPALFLECFCDTSFHLETYITFNIIIWHFIYYISYTTYVLIINTLYFHFPFLILFWFFNLLVSSRSRISLHVNKALVCWSQFPLVPKGQLCDFGS